MPCHRLGAPRMRSPWHRLGSAEIYRGIVCSKVFSQCFRNGMHVADVMQKFCARFRDAVRVAQKLSSFHNPLITFVFNCCENGWPPQNLQNRPQGECANCSISCVNIHHSAWNAHFPNVYAQLYHCVSVSRSGF